MQQRQSEPEHFGIAGVAAGNIPQSCKVCVVFVHRLTLPQLRMNRACEISPRQKRWLIRPA
jgi:hypothetical protein